MDMKRNLAQCSTIFILRDTYLKYFNSDVYIQDEPSFTTFTNLLAWLHKVRKQMTSLNVRTKIIKDPKTPLRDPKVTAWAKVRYKPNIRPNFFKKKNQTKLLDSRPLDCCGFVIFRNKQLRLLLNKYIT